MFNDAVHKSNNPLMRQALATILQHECQNYLQGSIFVFREQLVPNMMGFKESKTPQFYYSYVVVDVDITKPWTIKRYQDADGFYLNDCAGNHGLKPIEECQSKSINTSSLLSRVLELY